MRKKKKVEQKKRWKDIEQKRRKIEKKIVFEITSEQNEHEISLKLSTKGLEKK